MSARQRRNSPGNTLQETTQTGYGSHRIYADVSINSSAPIRFMVDTGADVSILSEASARTYRVDTSNRSGTLNLIGVTGGSGAPLVNVSMKIQTAQAFVTTVAVAASNFNLLCLRDLSRVYDVNIRGGQASLVPRSQAQIMAINTISDPELSQPEPTMEPFQLDENQIKIGILVVTLLLVLGVMS